jgi:hypothetical protein
MSSKRSWLPIILVIFGGIIMCGILVVGAGVWYFFNHIGIESASDESALKQFEEARKPFLHQAPLLAFTGRDVVVNREEIERSEPSDQHLESLNLLTWDPDEDQIVRVSIPFWVLRLKLDGRVSLRSGSDRFDSEDIPLTVGDLERRGPGLVLDATDERGQRVLIWTQ